MYYNKLRQNVAKIKLQEKQGEMKILNELKLKFEKPIWALAPELALIDTILNENPRLYEIVAADIAAVEQCPQGICLELLVLPAAQRRG